MSQRTFARASQCVLLFLVAASAFAAEPIGGWRGNGTGIWKEGNPPLVWNRLPRGAIEGLRSQPSKPAGKEPGEAPLVEKGQIREWLVLGPFPVANAEKDFDHDPLGGESAVQPSLGEKLAAREWQLAKVAPDDPNVFGEAGIPWLNLVPQLGFAEHQLAYAHAYLFSPRGGSARIVADHSWGLKAWVNGKEVFSADFEPAVSANPYIQFKFKATESGPVVLTWTDDDGSTIVGEDSIKVL